MDPNGLRPHKLTIAPSAFVAPGAVLCGDIALEDESSVWFQCVMRGDIEPIVIGAKSNVQDGTIVHVDHGYPTVVGQRVTIGHRAIIHGARLGDGCLIGMGATVLSGATIGQGALVAAGAVIREGFDVPAHTLAAGVPAKIVKALDPEARKRVQENHQHYVDYAKVYRAGYGENHR